jgi:hypothetical protein
MIRKTLALGTALLFVLGAHLRPACDYTLAGKELALGCSPTAGRLAIEAAEAAAEEILPGNARLPAVQRQLRLRLRRPEQDARVLSDALLRATPGITVNQAVYVGGVRMGAIREGVDFPAQLHRYIENTLPTWACGGALSSGLVLRTQYSRAGRETEPGDMLLLVTGRAPVLYYDEDGKIAAA